MIEVFGQLEGNDVKRMTLKGGGLTARVLNYGACLQDLRLEGHDASLVLGYDRFEDYLNHSPYFGASVGRFANRIKDGHFQVNGNSYQLDRNETTGNHLHGGTSGISDRIWEIEDAGANHVKLSILDPDEQCGYPGNCKITCSISLLDGGTFRIIYQSETDQPTIANIAHHSYFNLDGSEDIYDHELQINADRYLEVDDDLIPKGIPSAVKGSVFDFQKLRPVRTLDGFVAYDHNFCLSNEQRDKRHVAKVFSKTSNIELNVFSTEPGIQFYAGGGIKPSVEGLSGQTYKPGAGFCLETQIWPDAPNNSTYPNAILEVGETRVQETDYIFIKK
ncbi:aldose epimerase family protein [Lentilitoribacter sp. EG35]|uniref:aldose epimerase family protein n=1 Tax=Lentilitoribacter sp. EG35 TaxID=3234192 RepID=UPI00345FCF11